MITDTLLDGLKSLFSTLGAKTSDSNYAVGLYDKTSGEPKGLMGMSDLQSVLGVRNYGRIASGADLNTFIHPGIEIADFGDIDGIQNAPTGFYYGTILSITGNNQTMQFVNDTSNRLAIRSGDGGHFQAWKVISIS